MAEPAAAAIVPHLRAIVENTIKPGDLAALLSTADKISAFRYVAAPPISKDDLETLAEVVQTSVTQGDAAAVEKVRSTICQVIDVFRFPWVRQGRDPTAAELNAGVISCASMIATTTLATWRKNEANKAQEAAVKAELVKRGFVEVPRRRIGHIADAPKPGEFCPESIFGQTRGDIIVALHDRRVMPIECKASNSSVNSFKRLNHEALGKAVKWTNGFGPRHVVPAAVLSGVFSPSNVEDAQEAGLTIYWQSRISDLGDFVDAAR